jgi:hypothetical protein
MNFTLIIFFSLVIVIAFVAVLIFLIAFKKSSNQIQVLNFNYSNPSQITNIGNIEIPNYLIPTMPIILVSQSEPIICSLTATNPSFQNVIYYKNNPIYSIDQTFQPYSFCSFQTFSKTILIALVSDDKLQIFSITTDSSNNDSLIQWDPFVDLSRTNFIGSFLYIKDNMVHLLLANNSGTTDYFINTDTLQVIWNTDTFLKIDAISVSDSGNQAIISGNQILFDNKIIVDLYQPSFISNQGIYTDGSKIVINSGLSLIIYENDGSLYKVLHLDDYFLSEADQIAGNQFPFVLYQNTLIVQLISISTQEQKYVVFVLNNDEDKIFTYNQQWTPKTDQSLFVNSQNNFAYNPVNNILYVPGIQGNITILQL